MVELVKREEVDLIKSAAVGVGSVDRVGRGRSGSVELGGRLKGLGYAGWYGC